MSIAFPSLACFAELKRFMEEEQSRFRRLGFIDVTFGVRVTDGQKLKESKAYKLAFQTFACTEVKELTDADATDRPNSTSTCRQREKNHYGLLRYRRLSRD